MYEHFPPNCQNFLCVVVHVHVVISMDVHIELVLVCYWHNSLLHYIIKCVNTDLMIPAFVFISTGKVMDLHVPHVTVQRIPITAIVERLKVVYGEQKKTLNDDIIEVPRFCRCLEAILRHQQKG